MRGACHSLSQNRHHAPGPAQGPGWRVGRRPRGDVRCARRGSHGGAGQADPAPAFRVRVSAPRLLPPETSVLARPGRQLRREGSCGAPAGVASAGSGELGSQAAVRVVKAAWAPCRRCTFSTSCAWNGRSRPRQAPFLPSVP